MYAGEPGPPFSQSNAKSCIQALLKNREQYPVNSGQASANGNTNLSVLSESTDFGATLQNFELFNKLRASGENPDEINSPDSLDNQSDFNYSQKLFHIADGNLYSIFSPIQGRSYGMKPSFLSKQKYTVQECHSRGRKNLRKGLKFHNFLPSESVTSEKDSGYLRTKWKVHSECRLREEHGTKQITISNWSQSVQNSSKDPLNFPKPAVKCDSSMTRTKIEKPPGQSTVAKYSNIQNGNSEICNGNVDPYDFSLSLQNNIYENANTFSKNSKDSSATVSKTHDSVRSAATKKDSLSFVLNSLLGRPNANENQNVTQSTEDIAFKSINQNHKHRRKPTQTRRVVPYVKYLSIMEENDSVPLDLSSKDSERKHVSETFDDQHCTKEKSNCILEENHTNVILKNPSLEFAHKNSPLVKPTTDNAFSNSEQLASLLQNQLSTPLMFLAPPFNNLKVPNQASEIEGQVPQETRNSNGNMNIAFSNKPIKVKHLLPTLNTNMGHPLINNDQYSAHKSLFKESQSRTRKRNQRSVIKQKLEDTFRQNGFLVKTKQVSDGEATFCKFRQLRKYTRYYFKSWQQHLPDEVHKMWKGFLPPKTVLPPVSGTTESVNGSSWEST